MGLGSFIRKVGRAVDPTSKSSALGGAVRTAITSIPGGSSVMGAIDTVNKIKGDAKPGAGSPTVAATPTGGPPASALPLDRKLIAGIALAAVAAFLVFRK